MQQIVFGVYSEGRTDDRFLPVLLQRVLTRIASAESVRPLDILAPLVLPRRSGDFIDQMRMVEQENIGLPLIFVHRDADHRSTNRVLTRFWLPWLETCSNPDQWIPVIPVRMTESWMLADLAALQRTFLVSGETLRAMEGVRASESLPDPKDVLRQIVRAGSTRRSGGFEELLAQRINLAELDRLGSFRELVSAVRRWFVKRRDIES